MFYLKKTNKDIINLEKETDIVLIFIEVDSKGSVCREIGFNDRGEIIHKCPSKGYVDGTYGIFDLAKFDVPNLKNDLTKEEFEELWNK